MPGRRAWNVAFRTVHLGAFGLLVGGHFWGVGPDRLVPALAVTVASGAALVALELHHGLDWLWLGKGLVIQAKLLLLLAVAVFWDARVPLLLAVIALASVGAHMPARFRNYSVLRRAVVTATPAELPRGGRP